MNARNQILTAVAASFGSGAVAALVVNGAFWVATGGFPSLVTTLIASQAVTWLWGGGQAYRLNRKWQQVVASYNQPALGEGIDIPHRPPVDDESGEAS